MVTRQRIGRPGNVVSYPGMGKGFVSSSIWVPHSCLFSGYRGSSR